MPSQQFSSGDLYIDVQFGDPLNMTVVGEVSLDTAHVFVEALEAVAAYPGAPDVAINVVLARFVGPTDAPLHEAAARARANGQRFSIISHPHPTAES
ncbi:MAG: hypothetical protein QOJ19_4245 [Acidimicrobiia bacterium]|nr:hypothetical protein [Acidimicrobiia bacterium]